MLLNHARDSGAEVVGEGYVPLGSQNVGPVVQEIVRSGRLAEMRGLMEWSRRVMLCARAHAQDQLNSLHVAAEYGVAPGPQAPRIIQARF